MRLPWSMVLLTLLVVFVFTHNVFAEVVGDQLKLFSATVVADAQSASARPAHNDPTLPTNWLSPVDWTTGPVYWKVVVTSKKTNLKLRLDLHFEREHPDGTVGAEEIAEAAHMIEVSTQGETLYGTLNPPSQWALYSTWIPSWEWTKPINGIYIIVYAFDDSKNQWVWFADSSVCAGYDFCFHGSSKQTDHLPMTIQTEAYATQLGKPFVPPPGWTNSGSISPTIPTEACPKKSMGDANCDGTVSLADYSVWRSEFTGRLTTLAADFNTDTKISLIDYQIWRRAYLAQ